jgi:NAD(P)-dependent dehydrogenase (short-subunit alcohol dehydrogenase family)
VRKADIRGKWALVTGASRGIGRQVALGLAAEGCHLVLQSRDLAHTAPLVADLAGRGIDVRPVAGELARPDDVERVIDEALRVSGGIDIAYNNAAVMTPRRSDWLTVPAEDLRASFEVNVVALVRICHRLLPGMIARRWGRIVNVTSGIANQPELIAYALSKAAVDKFVRDSVCRLEGTGVLMNLLDPGWLRTDLGGRDAPGAVESVLPGALVPVLVDDGTTGRFFAAQDYVGRTL